MRVVLQRVSRASVTIEDGSPARSGAGFCLLVGFTHGDTAAQVDWMAEKVAGLRLFTDADGKMNLGLDEVGGRCSSSRSSRSTATRRREGVPRSSTRLGPSWPCPSTSGSSRRFARAGLEVATGEFGADMQVEIHNDGPVTLILERDA